MITVQKVNSDAAAMIFILLLSTAMFFAGAGWQRARTQRDLEDLLHDAYTVAYQRATSAIFKTAVRAANPAFCRLAMKLSM